MTDKKNTYFPEKTETPVFPVEPLDQKKLKNGIIVRSPNWLGDAVMTFPALRMLKTLLPAGCCLCVLSPAGLCGLYRTLDCVDQVIPLADAHAFLNKEEKHEIRRMNPGAGFLFNNSFRDALAMKLAGVPRLFGTAARFRSVLLKRAYSFPARQDHVLNYPHQALKYTAMIQSCGAGAWDGAMPVMTPDPLQPLPEKIQNLCSGGKEILLLASGAAYGDAKRWDPEKFREVAKWWTSQGGLVLSLGGKKEYDSAQESIAGVDNAYNLAGETSLNDLLHLFKCSGLFLGNDSGLMHYAAAAGMKGAAVFASTDPAATGPLSPDWIILHEKQSCSPCFKRMCPEGTRKCFAPITAERAIEALKKLTE